ncbi:MAG: L,D-transpeptidase family protein [Candidatus Omnitrophica bacterium]|nr:L,D-transpeptidase family protein [Candidatus Omnitrophota bacterium]
MPTAALPKRPTPLILPLRIIISAGLIALRLSCPGVVAAAESPQSEAPQNPHPGQAVYERALAYDNNRDWVQAKQAYKQLRQEYPDYPNLSLVEKKLAQANIGIIRSGIVIPPESIVYTVQPGESLDKLARRFHTTLTLIVENNSLTTTRIRPGQTLRVWNAPFTIIVDKTNNRLVLKTDAEIIKTYPIATGAEGGTPAGEFTITSKISNPTWFHKGEVIAPDNPRNALGTRWLGLDKPQYGIHGTIQPELIGRQVSHGCIRMLNADVEELYDLIPLGTKVIIID